MGLGTSPSWCRNARYHGHVVPCSQVEAVELAWQQNCTMVLCGVTVPPNLFGEEGAIISPSLMARQEQTPLAQEHQRESKGM